MGDVYHFACARCGAKAGERCRNYKGQNKATCRGRGEPPAPPRKRPVRPVLKQYDLFDLLDGRGPPEPPLDGGDA